MASILNIKGQVTIPKQIRDELNLKPGCKLNFVVNDTGAIVIQKAEVKNAYTNHKKVNKAATQDRFEQVRGRADIKWRTQDLMELLRG